MWEIDERVGEQWGCLGIRRSSSIVPSPLFHRALLTPLHCTFSSSLPDSTQLPAAYEIVRRESCLSQRHDLSRHVCKAPRCTCGTQGSLAGPKPTSWTCPSSSNRNPSTAHQPGRRAAGTIHRTNHTPKQWVRLASHCSISNIPGANPSKMFPSAADAFSSPARSGPTTTTRSRPTGPPSARKSLSRVCSRTRR